jgi:1-acyl-sn-glycerol-3-phosphate acyltransferase
MLRGVWVAIVVVVATVALGLPAAVVSLARRRSDIVMRLGKLWSRLILAAAGVQVVYRGGEHVPSDRSCVFIANHQSLLDIWALTPALPLSTRFVAKQSLFQIPFLGWAMAASGFIPVDRANRTRAVRSLSRAAERIRDGRCVILFPEGTRSRDGRLAPFKKGGFHLALQAGVPVIPVAISGSFRALAPGTMRVRPGEVRVAFAPPIVPSPSGPAAVDDLMRAVREAIAERLDPHEIDRGLAVAGAPSR